MKAILTNETINILGGQMNTNSASEETAHSEIPHRETKFGRFKSKIKKIWAGILNIAEDIKEKIIPVVEPTIKAIAGLITSIAVFRNSRRKYAGRVA